jgi:hypothetical protein
LTKEKWGSLVYSKKKEVDVSEIQTALNSMDYRVNKATQLNKENRQAVPK